MQFRSRLRAIRRVVKIALKLIWTIKCPHCDAEFIDWRVSGQDDVMSSAHYVQDGALLCVGCVGRHDADEMAFDDEGYIPDDYR